MFAAPELADKLHEGVPVLAIRVFWAEPGPKADEALRRYWALADEIAVEIISRQALTKARTALAAGNTEKPEEPEE